ncbi:MAG TPA: PPC domain-containing protein [Noviherbaspirillum sp.]
MADILNTTSTTSVLTVNGAAGSSTIDIAEDQDWWSVALTANSTYVFSLNGAGLRDPYLRLMGPTGTFITADDDSGGNLNAKITYTPTTSGTYYLSAQAFTSNTGAYLISATSSTPDTILGTTGTTSSLVIGNTGTSSVDIANDQDWWRVSLTEGTTYQFQLNSGAVSGIADPYLRLLDSAGTQITADDDGGAGTNSLITYTATATADYYLSAQGYAHNMGSYSLVTSAIASADTIAASAATASTVAIGGSGSSAIDTAADQDWWGVTLTAGTTYRFQLNGGTLTDPNLRLLEADGDFVTSDDDGGTGLNSEIIHTAATSGTYYLSAQAFGNNTGTYTITADTVVPTVDAILGTTATASTATVGGAASSGTIDTGGDQDWFSVTLTGGTSYQFALDGGTLSDPFLRLLDSNGVQIATNDDGGAGLNSLLTYTPVSDGTYFLSAQAYADNTGTYTLTATSRGATPDIITGITTTSSLTVDAAASTSTIDVAGDDDWWSVSLDAGTHYRFTLDGNGLADPVLRLMDATGTQIKYDDDSGAGWNASLTYSPTITGTYYLSAQGYGIDTGDYAIRAVTYTP